MALLPPDPGEAGRFHERMTRAGAPGAVRGRRAPSGRRGGLRLDCKIWLAIDAAGLLVFVTMIAVWPPLSTCRTQAREVGLYAGDSIETCTRRGVAERLGRADQRIKMLIRGSGQ